jgi:hypothetical protein
VAVVDSIIGRSGDVVARFAPPTKPDDPEVLNVLEAELARNAKFICKACGRVANDRKYLCEPLALG